MIRNDPEAQTIPPADEVHELGGGSASVPFSYRVVALRKKYENVRLEDHTHDLDGHNKMMERMKRAKTQASASR